jgi:hypothetical protein
MTQQMTDDWKARQENLDAIGYDLVLTNAHDEPPAEDWKARQENLFHMDEQIDLDAIEQQILKLFKELPLNRVQALLEELKESIADDECDRARPLDDEDE